MRVTSTWQGIKPLRVRYPVVPWTPEAAGGCGRAAALVRGGTAGAGAGGACRVRRLARGAEGDRRGGRGGTGGGSRHRDGGEPAVASRHPGAAAGGAAAGAAVQ